MSFISLLQVQKLKDYVPFCANQVFGKAMLDEKKNDPAVDDFLQRCQDSPFSRKLDLWTLLGMVFPDIQDTISVEFSAKIKFCVLSIKLWMYF